MKTLAISGGDLVVGGAGYATVSGISKTVQDLSILLREPMGADRFHPQLGSRLDSFVGTPIDEETALLVRSEVTRIVSNYIAVLSELAERDVLANGASRLSESEMVSDVEGVDVVRQGVDRIGVVLRLVTASGQRVSLTRTVER